MLESEREGTGTGEGRVGSVLVLVAEDAEDALKGAKMGFLKIWRRWWSFYISVKLASF
jgi:hypothetical protein